MQAARRGKSKTYQISAIPTEIWEAHKAQGHVIRDVRAQDEKYRQLIFVYISSEHGENLHLWEKKDTHTRWHYIKGIKTRRFA